MTININMGIVFRIKLYTQKNFSKNVVNGIWDLKQQLD